jgi:hypothetical protein
VFWLFFLNVIFSLEQVLTACTAEISNDDQILQTVTATLSETWVSTQCLASPGTVWIAASREAARRRVSAGGVLTASRRDLCQGSNPPPPEVLPVVLIREDRALPPKLFYIIGPLPFIPYLLSFRSSNLFRERITSVRSSGWGKLKKFNDLIGTRTRDLPDCSIGLQPCSLFEQGTLRT